MLSELVDLVFGNFESDYLDLAFEFPAVEVRDQTIEAAAEGCLAASARSG